MDKEMILERYGECIHELFHDERKDINVMKGIFVGPCIVKDKVRAAIKKEPKSYRARQSNLRHQTKFPFYRDNKHFE